jgi:hypothetical protein
MEEPQSPPTDTNEYTFGDNGLASARLWRLAEMYEPESREPLHRGGVRAPRLAVDLGCGFGWSTRLLQDALKPRRTVGLDSSDEAVGPPDFGMTATGMRNYAYAPQ